MNSYDLAFNGGDYDGDQVAIFSLLTEESQKEAKSKMNPKHSKSSWANCNNHQGTKVRLSLDACSTIYGATKN